MESFDKLIQSIHTEDKTDQSEKMVDTGDVTDHTAPKERRESMKIIKAAIKNTQKIVDAIHKDDVSRFKKRFSSCNLWTRDTETNQTILDIILDAKARSIIDLLNATPVSDEDISNFLFLLESDVSGEYKLLRQHLLHRCIQHNNNWGFMKLCSAEAINEGPLWNEITCLELATTYRRSLCVKQILQKYFDVNVSWIHAKVIAIDSGYQEIISLIDQRLADVQRNNELGNNRMHLAVLENDADMVDYILRKGRISKTTKVLRDSPLMVAVANRKEECIETFRLHRTKVEGVNKHRQTILHAAVEGKWKSIPEWFMWDQEQLEQQDCTNLTVLHKAVIADMEGIVSQLVSVGANHRKIIQATLSDVEMELEANSTNKPQIQLTSKENAASLCLKLKGHLYSCFFDVLHEEDISFTDENGNTLLHMTALLKDADACKKLIGKGANLTAKNTAGRTPFMELLHDFHQVKQELNDNLLKTAGYLIGAVDTNGQTVVTESLLRELVEHDACVSKLTSDEFEKFLEMKMFSFLEILVPRIPSESFHKWITVKKLREIITSFPQSTYRIVFEHADSAVRLSVVDEIMLEDVITDDLDHFDKLLQQHDVSWTVMPNGETLLTTLLKRGNVKFSRYLLAMHNKFSLVELVNKCGDTPLMVAINSDVDELIEELIMKTNDLECENESGSSALSLLFEKVSKSIGEKRAQMILWIKQIISRYVDINKINKQGLSIISFCTDDELKSEFEQFSQKQKKSSNTIKTPKVPRQDSTLSIICSVCKDRMINCTLGCGHTTCTDCAQIIDKCPRCGENVKNRKPILG